MQGHLNTAVCLSGAIEGFLSLWAVTLTPSFRVEHTTGTWGLEGGQPWDLACLWLALLDSSSGRL